MRRFVVLNLVIVLICSLAAPTGAVFATTGIGDLDTGVGLDGHSLDIPEDPAGGTSSEVQQAKPGQLANEVSLEQTDTEVLEVGDQGIVAVSDSLSSSEIVVLPEPILPTSPIIVTAFKASGQHVHLIQLYNNSSTNVSVAGWSLMYVANGIEYPIMLPDAWILARQYTVIAWEGEAVYADAEFRFDGDLSAGKLTSIELTNDLYEPHLVTVSNAYNGALWHRFKSTAGNYTTNTTFAEREPTATSGGLYTVPGQPDLSVLEIMVHPRSCIVGDEADDCYDYIKVRNDGADSLDLSLYRFRTGYGNTTASLTNTTYASNILQPGEVVTLTHDASGNRLTITANDGTVWLEDVYGYATYVLDVPPYVGSSLTSKKGFSWAYDARDEIWKWAVPSPHMNENVFLDEALASTTATTTQLADCGEGRERNPATNRCRNIASGSTLVPCREGQYRSEETNRCRSIAAAASALKPCADDQFRNPETNRCKKIASTDDLADCGEGRERNPETNRCRNVLASVPEVAGYAVEPITQTAGALWGWWVLGGVGALALGYAAWEWRVEVASVIRKSGSFFHSKK